MPIVAVRKMRAYTSGGGLRLLFLVVMIKAVLAFLAWLVVVGLLFAPAAWIYEWFVLAEVTQVRGLPRLLAPLGKTLRWPLWLRLALSLCIIVGGWILLFWKVFGLTAALTLQIMGGLFGVHFAILALLIGLRKLRSRGGQWRERRSLRRKQMQIAAAAG
jgi:hypothetical protein